MKYVKVKMEADKDEEKDKKICYDAVIALHHSYSRIVHAKHAAERLDKDYNMIKFFNIALKELSALNKTSMKLDLTKKLRS